MDKKDQAIAGHKPWLSMFRNKLSSTVFPLTMIPVSIVVSIVWLKKVDGFFDASCSPDLTPCSGKVYGKNGL